MSDASPYARELHVATALVRRVGAILLEEGERTTHAGRGPGKLDVDVAMEAALADGLHAAFPGDGILAEEGTRRPGGARRWVVDPHDGTSDFSAGARETSISVALEDEGRLVLGVVHAPGVARVSDPALRGLLGGAPFLASWAQGGPLRRDGHVVPPGAVPTRIGPTTIALVSRRIRGETLEANRRAMAPGRVLPCASIATRLALVACGAVDVAYTMRNPLAPWDYLGGQALLHGAGGALLDARGLPVGPGHDGNAYVAARSPALAQEVVGRLRSAFPDAFP